MRSPKQALATAATVVAVATSALFAPGQAAAAPIVLHANVGPGHQITLRTAAGARVTTVRAGRAYTLVVRDQSKIHNFRLTGPGVSRATGLPFVGTVRWSVTFRAGTYRFRCDPHADMRGSFRAA